MRKIRNLIGGALIGALLGYIFKFCQNIFSVISDSHAPNNTSVIILSITVAFIGLIIGISDDKDEAKWKQQEAERQRQEAERQRQLELERIERERKKAFNNWKQTLDNKFREIEHMTTQELLSTDIYNKIFNEIPIDEDYRQYYYSVLNKHRNKMISDIQGKIQKNAKGLYFSLDKMYFLKAILH